MKRSKRTDAIDGENEIPLPEVIIQHIQSLLNRKQAAQTTIISKSWRNAWLTSPNLDLDQNNFLNRGQIADAFSEFANKTIQRYQQSNLKIANFRLCMKSTHGSLASELISKAMKMDVHDLDFEFNPPTETFVLPDEVLGAETLIGLSLIGCKIDRPVGGKVNCSKLKFLCLRRVYIGNGVVWDIISSCPLIEKLLLSECECVIDIETSTVGRKTITSLAFSNPVIALFEFRNLKFLSLDGLNIGHSLKFHCLIELTLSRCSSIGQIQISSSSLERLTLEHMKIAKATFDIPNMHEFKFSGSSFPILSFSTVREWLSEISISCSSHRPGGLWFHDLKRFLRYFSQSKISLSIVFLLEMEIYDVGGVGGLPRQVVENLMLSVHSSSSVCSPLLNGLFWSFRPKAITQYWFPRSHVAEKANNELLELLCKTLIEQDCCVFFGLRDLEEVNVEMFEETLGEWRPMPWKTLLDASTTSPENVQKIRFQLRWREKPITSV